MLDRLKKGTIKLCQQQSPLHKTLAKGRAWTPSQLITEIENDTKLGIDLISGMVTLTADLVLRGKIEPPTDVETFTLNFSNKLVIAIRKKILNMLHKRSTNIVAYIYDFSYGELFIEIETNTILGQNFLLMVISMTVGRLEGKEVIRPDKVSLINKEN